MPFTTTASGVQQEFSAMPFFYVFSPGTPRPGPFSLEGSFYKSIVAVTMYSSVAGKMLVPSVVFFYF